MFVKHYVKGFCKYFGLELKEEKLVETDDFQRKLKINI
jgi:hypothetical protein